MSDFFDIAGSFPETATACTACSRPVWVPEHCACCSCPLCKSCGVSLNGAPADCPACHADMLAYLSEAPL